MFFRQALLRVMARVKIAAGSFTAHDMVFLKEYAKVMEPMATALDLLQGESQAYLGCLLPTLAVAQMLLEDALTKPLAFCKPLVRALLEGINKRFGHLFEDKTSLLAAGFHPKFRLMWLHKLDPSQVRKVRQWMEEEVEACLKDVVQISAGISSEEEEAATEDDWYGLITQSTRETSSTRHMYRNRANKIVSNWLAGISKKDFSDATFMYEPVLVKLFTRFNTPIPSSAAVERFFSQGKDILRAKRSSLADKNFEMLMFLRGNRHLRGSMPTDET
jgi:hypothetical protein